MNSFVRPSDYVGLAAFSAFGLWCMAFPASVIRFYAWFHRKTVPLPKVTAVRVTGLLWVAIVVSMSIWGRRT